LVNSNNLSNGEASSLTTDNKVGREKKTNIFPSLLIFGIFIK